MAKKQVRVITAQDKATAMSTPKPRRTVVASDNPKPSKLTNNEIQARVNKKYATSTMGGFGGGRGSGFGIRTAGDVVNSGQGQFYSPQLSTDFLEKPQNLRERRAFYRFFYNTNEIIGRAIDIHSTLPLSKLRLVPPKGKNKKQNEYVFKFFQTMCDDMKLFKTLIEITHEFWLFGNCVVGDSLLRTPNGFVPAKDIKIDDMVLTHKGRWRPVLKQCSREAENILSFDIFKTFQKLRFSQEHPIEVYRDNSFVFIRSEEATKEDYIRVTWPSLIKDVESVDYIDTSKVNKTKTGYEYSVSFPRERDQDAHKAPKFMVSWLTSLSEPVVRTRKSLAGECGVRESTLSNVLTQIDQEVGSEYHKRIGPSEFQGGSQVQWCMINTPISIDPSYNVERKITCSSPHKIIIDDDFSYLLGYWLGDGTLGRDKSRNNWGRGNWQIVFGKSSQLQFHRIKNILSNILGEDCLKVWTSLGLTYLKVNSNPAFLEWWSNNFGDKSKGNNPKHIPLWFSELPVNKLKHLLMGLIDSDGCISQNGKGCITLALSSKTIIEVVREIAFKCGVVFNYRRAKERQVKLPNGTFTKSKPMYILNTREEQSCRILSENTCKRIPSGTVFSKGFKFYKRVGSDIAFKIKSIKEDPGEKVYNFEVEEDHTYQVNGFSTHNCFVFCEDHDISDGLKPDEIQLKKEEAQTKRKFLKEKYDIKDNNPLYKGWKKMLILPPDQVRVQKLPLTDDIAVEYVPDPETRKFLTSEMPMYQNSDGQGLTPSGMNYQIPADLRDKILQSGTIPLDTNPDLGSYVYHLARKKSQYEPLGVSIIERCINTLVLLDKLRQAQTSIASRHMTPMRVVWADDLSDGDVDSLREQVDLALVDPDFSIIANYEIHWEEIGSNNRLLEIEGENEAGLSRLLSGLGLTREIMTGEGSYSGSRVALEVMNTEYLLFREVLQDYIENFIFKPVAKRKGFMEYDEFGNEVLLYPRLSFTRLSIRDNEQFFDAAFQLYQKGSVSIDLILDILNIDPDSTKEKIEKDMWTVNDSQFNEVLRNVYTTVATPLAENTNLTERLAEYMKLKMKDPDTEGEGEEEGETRFSSETPPARRTVVKKGAGKGQAEKMAKMVKYFEDNPEKLEKIFA